MRISSGIAIFFLLILIILPSCREKNKPETLATEIIEDDSAAGNGNVRLIFYNMYLPTEMSRMFERAGANYTPGILNPVDNFSRYDENSMIALNIGVYGVDLSYCRIFNQNAATAKYFSTIQMLYEKLGIPDYYYNDLITGLEKYYSNKDSLAKFASDVYERADHYLRENNKDISAAMIITGGWIESLYLASKIAESNPENVEIIERIAGQKYSLNSLISLLSNYQENIVVTEYVLMLKGLKKSFDKIDIYYIQDSFQLDTINKLISASYFNIQFSPDVLKEINNAISEIRSEIVD
jgi:hypothetical protein